MAWPAEGLLALGDDVLAGGDESSPGCLSFLEARLGLRAWSLAEAGATSGQIRSEQLPLAVAMRPVRAILCAGTPEALQHLHEASFGNASFVMRLLADVGAMAGALRAAGAALVLVRPPSLDCAPAAWLRFGRQRPRAGLDASRMLRTALRNLRAVGRSWSEGLGELALRHDASFVDLSLLFDDALAGGDDAIGLPPCSGSETDLFADPLRLSVMGASLAADLLLPALGQDRRAQRSAGHPAHC